jgi:hypothetical protein
MTTAEILRRAGVTREELGRKVRTQWIAWALAQPVQKRHWLLPYDAISPADQEADCQIGEELFCLGWEARLP